MYLDVEVRWGLEDGEVCVLEGGETSPDSLEPAGNGLIQSEWDALITAVVKTQGGRVEGWDNMRFDPGLSEL